MKEDKKVMFAFGLHSPYPDVREAVVASLLKVLADKKAPKEEKQLDAVALAAIVEHNYFNNFATTSLFPQLLNFLLACNEMQDTYVSNS